MNLNNKFTTADVENLLASKDDSQNRQLRVDSNGQAYLSDIVGNRNIEGLAFRLESWQAGNDYTGPKAAANSDFVSRIEKVLRDNWPNPTTSYIDIF